MIFGILNASLRRGVGICFLKSNQLRLIQSQVLNSEFLSIRVSIIFFLLLSQFSQGEHVVGESSH